MDNIIIDVFTLQIFIRYRQSLRNKFNHQLIVVLFTVNFEKCSHSHIFFREKSGQIGRTANLSQLENANNEIN